MNGVHSRARLIRGQDGVFAPQRVDNRAQPGIGGTHEINSVFDGPEGG